MVPQWLALLVAGAVIATSFGWNPFRTDEPGPVPGAVELKQQHPGSGLTVEP